MHKIINKIIDKLLKDEKIINEKTHGIFFLEKIKYIILEEFLNTEISQMKELFKELKNIENQFIEIELEKIPLIFITKYYQESLSVIKFSIEKDKLSIVLEGNKSISIIDLRDEKKSELLNLHKNMGTVLSKNTVVTEKIATGSIIFDIISKNDYINVEN